MITTWREFINNNLDDAIKHLENAKEALSENDCLGAGFQTGRAETKLRDMANRAYDVIAEQLDVPMDAK
jgi:hypothetical protein